MRLASFLPTIARPSLPAAAAAIAERLPAPAVLAATPTPGKGEQAKVQLSIEEFAQFARNAGAL